MAGDWIRIRHSLPGDPSVLKLMSLLQLEDPDYGVGKLVRFWIWASEQTSDGTLKDVDLRQIDMIVRQTGFGQALLDVGWLQRTRGVLRIPKYDAHMSSSAKARGGEAIRKATSRSRAAQRYPKLDGPDKCPDVCPDKSVTRAAAESTREERRENSSTVLRSSAPLSRAAASPPPSTAARGSSSCEVAELLLQLRYKDLPVFTLPEALEVAADPRFMPDHIAYAQDRLDKYKKPVGNPAGLARSLMSQKPAKWKDAIRLQDLRRMADVFRKTSGGTANGAPFDPRVNPNASGSGGPP